jgi:hypothetical protein
MTLPAAFLFAALAGTSIPTPARVRIAVERALPPLKLAAETHAEKKSCFGCHNQAFPMAAFAAAKKLGLAVEGDLIKSQVAHVRQFVSTNRKKYDDRTGTGGQVDTAGWLLFTLELAGDKPDDDTAAIIDYVLHRHADRSHWACSSDRPPSEASSFGTTYLAVRALKAWGTEKQKAAVEKRIAAARDWAAATKPKDTEDRVFRLLLLHAAGADAKVVEAAANELRDGQGPDGGWPQKAGMGSDPYATGTALSALAMTNTLPPAASAYRRGVGFLLRTQQADGTWFVKTRSKPFQPYYEGGFPYEKDQFISSSASGWAVVALAAAAGRE